MRLQRELTVVDRSSVIMSEMSGGACESVFSGNAAHDLRFSRYRHHRIFSPAELLRLKHGELSTRMQQDGAIVAHCISMKQGSEAYGVCTPLVWESAHFGLPLGVMDYAMAGGADLAAASKMVAVLLQKARESGLCHLSAIVDAEDFDTFNLLMHAGFSMIDSRHVYYMRRPRSIRSGKTVCEVRNYVEGDEALLMPIMKEAGFVSRYTRDPVFDAGKVSAMYELWMRNLLGKPATDRVALMALRNGRLVAGGGVQRLDFSAYGISGELWGNSIVATGPAGVGSAGSLVEACLRQGFERGMPMEFVVSYGNRGMSRVLEASGCEHVLTQHVLRMML